MSISFSVVSHGHGDQVLALMDSLVSSGLIAEGGECEFLLTLNVPEPDLKSEVLRRSWPFRIVCIENPAPLGFGANHNQAFARAQGSVFAVVNPDIVFLSSVGVLTQMSEFNVGVGGVGMWVPKQVDRKGCSQDHCRKLLTPWGVFARGVLRLMRVRHLPGAVGAVEQADWVNAACLLLSRNVYCAIGGFDERYFMYCEDADLCLRLQLQGWKMRSAPFTVIHDAQRNSFRAGKHLLWHMASLARLWCSAVFWRYWFRSMVQMRSKSLR